MKKVNRCRFEVRNLANPDRPGQVLQFIEKNRGAVVNDGTTNAELVRVLLARLDDLPSSTEVEEARKHFEVGLAHLQARTARRTARELARKHFD
jgi:hypothetical protein